MSQIPAQKSKKNTCPYCGNNPTNHALSYFTQTMLVKTAPLSNFIQSRRSIRFDHTMHRLFMELVWSFARAGIWGINKDSKKAPTERSLVIWEEATKRGIEMEGLIVYGKYVEHHRAKIDKQWFHFESLPIPGKFKEDG